jgi:hypothetical protein
MVSTRGHMMACDRALGSRVPPSGANHQLPPTIRRFFSGFKSPSRLCSIASGSIANHSTLPAVGVRAIEAGFGTGLIRGWVSEVDMRVA